MSLCTTVLIEPHDYNPPDGVEKFHQDIAPSRGIGHSRGRCVDLGGGHGHTLGALGEAI